VRAALILLTGCWTVTSAPSAQPVQPEARPYADSYQHRSPAPPLRREPFPRHSVWQGTYVCSQGLTAVTVTLDIALDGEASGVYEFGPVASNPTVPEGSFEMTGKVEPNGPGSFSAQLTPGAWINRPSNYVAVAMTIEAVDRDMTGTIESPNCRDFKVRRVD
jgi:hypothetical protein